MEGLDGWKSVEWVTPSVLNGVDDALFCLAKWYNTQYLKAVQMSDSKPYHFVCLISADRVRLHFMLQLLIVNLNNIIWVLLFDVI